MILNRGEQKHQRWATVALILIIAFSAAVSTYRVFSLPILQCPDEDSHIDYAFSLYSAGHLLNVRDAPSSGWNVKHRAPYHKWERISHRYTLHLTDATRMYQVRISEDGKVPEDYGTRSFFDQIDRTAPQSPAKTDGLAPVDNPGLVSMYPFGYYALVAAEMWVVRLFSDSLVWTFFSARLLSVGLLIATLALSFAVLRQVHSRYALPITAIVGLFPVTTYVSSCVQADNLSLTLVVLSWYLGLLAYKDFDRRYVRIFLSVSLSVLLVTKQHHYIFAAVPILALLIAKHRPSPAVILAMLFPSLALYSVQVWIEWKPPFESKFVTFALDRLLAGIPRAIMEYYGGGYAYTSYWSTSYGWKTVPNFMKVILQVSTVLALLAVAIGLAKTAVRLWIIAKWRPTIALPLALDPLATGHLLFLGFMILLFALTANEFTAQGRHFFPYVLSGFYLVVTFAPRILPSGRLRNRLSTLVIILLLMSCAVGQYHALAALGPRYYPDASSVSRGLR